MVIPLFKIEIVMKTLKLIEFLIFLTFVLWYLWGFEQYTCGQDGKKL